MRNLEIDSHAHMLLRAVIACCLRNCAFCNDLDIFALVPVGERLSFLHELCPLYGFREDIGGSHVLGADM